MYVTRGIRTGPASDLGVAKTVLIVLGQVLIID